MPPLRIKLSLEEIQARVSFIEEKIGFIIDSVKRIQQDLAISSTLTDAEEKHLLVKLSVMYDALMKVITKVFPDDSVSSEEEHRQHGKNNFTWVLDPIDGSMNFLRKLPLMQINRHPTPRFKCCRRCNRSRIKRCIQSNSWSRGY